MKTIVVNLLGAAGSGKSVLAADVFLRLKKKGYNCENVEEYAKRIVYEENYKKLNNQLMIFGNQYYSLDMLRDKVNIIITDSSLLLSIFYNKNITEPSKIPDDLFRQMVLHCYSTFDNLNYFIKRNHEYKKEGRYQDEPRAKEEELIIQKMVDEMNVECKTLLSSDNCAEQIVEEVEKRYAFYQNLLKSGLEIERKFLLKDFPSDLDKTTKKFILQGYIVKNEHEIRVRNINNEQFYLTEKYGLGIQREEYEKEIDKNEFDELMKKAGKRLIKKTRYFYKLTDGKIAEIDVYFGNNLGLKTVEVEFESLDDARSFVPPSWFGKDVSDDKSLSNSILSLNEIDVCENNKNILCQKQFEKSI